MLKGGRSIMQCIMRVTICIIQVTQYILKGNKGIVQVVKSLLLLCSAS